MNGATGVWHKKKRSDWFIGELYIGEMIAPLPLCSRLSGEQLPRLIHLWLEIHSVNVFDVVISTICPAGICRTYSRSRFLLMRARNRRESEEQSILFFIGIPSNAATNCVDVTWFVLSLSPMVSERWQETIFLRVLLLCIRLDSWVINGH